jgi:hypothetical protein
VDPQAVGDFTEEVAMASRTTRQAARARILAAFAAQLDRIIPADETVALKGATFADFEDQVETLVRAAVPVVLEERAALAPNAAVTTAGRCPHCGSAAGYLKPEVTQPERRSRHGVVVLPQQHARCRTCGGSFSPSGARLGPAGGGAADVPGGAAAGAGERGAGLRCGGAGLE